MPTMKKAKVEIRDAVLVWNWADETSTIVEIDALGDNIQEQAMKHGLKQKLSDSYAGATTVMEAKQALESVLNALLSGTWNAGRSSSGGIWVEAIARAAGRSVEEALEVWNAKSEEEQKELKKHPGIKQAKAEIDLERAKAKAEGTSLDLGEI